MSYIFIPSPHVIMYLNLLCILGRNYLYRITLKHKIFQIKF